MNILVIGNGFDLAHGLPTKYTDFLEFTNNYTSYEKNLLNSLLDETKKLMTGNKWLRHFKRFYGGNGWIDFEKEISNIVQLLEKKNPQFDGLREKGVGVVKFNNNERIILKNFDSSVANGFTEDTDFIYNINKKMQNDLNRLIRCLEIYLDGYINCIPICCLSPDIIELRIDKVISFNYTNSYERLYGTAQGDDIEYDYIHGKADINNTIESNNMVLGIDEYLPDDRKNKDVEFIAFKKYYQRIYKQTGCKYKEWVDEIRQDYFEYLQRIEGVNSKDMQYVPDKSQRIFNKYAMLAMKSEKCLIHNLYIFGHSLDITDKDILRDLILNDNVKTIIFHHSKNVMGQQIANLVKIIGQEELIRRTGGSTKTIEFRLQQEMTVIV